MTGDKPVVASFREMPYPSYRKWFGLGLVTLSSLVYGLVSQTINHIFMPGIPLYQPPFGALGNILMALLIGASLGILVAWADTGGIAVLWGSLLCALFVSIATLFTGQNQNAVFWHKLVAVAIIFVPTAAALAPLLIVFRWAIGREEENYRNASKGFPSSPFRRYALPAGLVLLAGGLGLFSLLNDLGRAALPRMDQLIQLGRQAQNIESLPAPLRPPDVKLFSAQASGPYTLQWDKDDQNQFSIPRPAGSSFDQSTVIARFDSGYLLVCMFPGKTGLPSCRDFPSP